MFHTQSCWALNGLAIVICMAQFGSFKAMSPLGYWYSGACSLDHDCTDITNDGVIWLLLNHQSSAGVAGCDFGGLRFGVALNAKLPKSYAATNQKMW